MKNYDRSRPTFVRETIEVFTQSVKNLFKIIQHLIIKISSNAKIDIDFRPKGPWCWVCGSNLEPAKWNTVLPTGGQRCEISSEKAALPKRNDADLGPSTHYTRFGDDTGSI